MKERRVLSQTLGDTIQDPVGRPAAWIDAQLEQLGEKRNMHFRIAGEGSWVANAIKGRRILNVHVNLGDDGLVHVTADAGKHVNPDRLDEYRIFQMAQNDHFATRGYRRAEIGEPVVFTFHIAPGEDVDLCTLVDNAIQVIVRQTSAFERIDRGDSVEEVCFDLKKDYTKRLVFCLTSGVAAHFFGE